MKMLHITSVLIDRCANIMQVLCWRTVPTNNGNIGEVARSSEPFMRQVFLVPTAPFQEDDLKKQVSLMHVIG